MRPFGNDITNIANNGNSNNAGNGNGNGNAINNNNNNNNNNNSNNNNSNGNGNVNGNGNTGGNPDGNDAVAADTEATVDPRLPPHIARIGGIVTFSPIAGHGVIRVVRRCEDAKENNILDRLKKLVKMAHLVVKVIERCEQAAENNELDLSSCELMQIPDAVYHLMRNTEIKTCDLSGNVLKRIAPKFAHKFTLITELNLSSNHLSRLPDEFANLTALARLDISHNLFMALPLVVLKIPKLRELDASNNKIIELDTDEGIASDCLELVDLRHNPLSRTCRRKLNDFVTNFRLEISEACSDDEDGW